MAERLLAGQREVIALGIMLHRHMLSRKAVEQAEQLRRAMAGRIDHGPNRIGRGIVAAEIDAEAFRLAPPAGDRRVQGKRAAGRLAFAEQRQHQRMAVDHAGLGREQGDLAAHLWLQRLRLGAGKPAQRVDAGSLRASHDSLQRRLLALGGGDDQLAAGLVRQATLPKVAVE